MHSTYKSNIDQSITILGIKYHTSGTYTTDTVSAMITYIQLWGMKPAVLGRLRKKTGRRVPYCLRHDEASFCSTPESAPLEIHWTCLTRLFQKILISALTAFVLYVQSYIVKAFIIVVTPSAPQLGFLWPCSSSALLYTSWVGNLSTFSLRLRREQSYDPWLNKTWDKDDDCYLEKSYRCCLCILYGVIISMTNHTWEAEDFFWVQKISTSRPRTSVLIKKWYIISAQSLPSCRQPTYIKWAEAPTVGRNSRVTKNL